MMIYLHIQEMATQEMHGTVQMMAAIRYLMRSLIVFLVISRNLQTEIMNIIKPISTELIMKILLKNEDFRLKNF